MATLYGSDEEEMLSELAFEADELVKQLDMVTSRALKAPRMDLDQNDTGHIDRDTISFTNYLPPEIILQIVSHINDTQTLYSSCLISRAWYEATMPRLYTNPALSYSNFRQFAGVIAPTARMPQIHEYPLGHLVKTLNLANVTYLEHLRMLSTRLITHTGPSLQSFTAPQKSFGGSALRALKHCTNLVYLDLSTCFEVVNLMDLFNIVSTSLRLLETLHFPRSSVLTVTQGTNSSRNKAEPVNTAKAFEYPPNLVTLSFRGGFTDTILMSVHSHPPKTLKTMHLSHFAFVSYNATRHFLNRTSQHITSLTILHPFSRLRHDAFNNVLIICPLLNYLHISVDYITSRLFDHHANTLPDCPLEVLVLDGSEALGINMKVRPDDISIALMEGRLPCLRIIKASLKLGWGRPQEKEDVKDLAELLSADRAVFGKEDEEDQPDNGYPSSMEDAKEDEEVNGKVGAITEGKASGLWLF